jgi:hypothetical protein
MALPLLFANPLFQKALLSFGPALLSKLGLFGKDPQKELQKKMARLTDPRYQQGLTAQNYQQALSSPAYSQAQGSIALGANTAGADVARAVASRGIGTSGVGAIVPALQSSMVGSQQAGLRTSAYQGAQQQAQSQIANQLAALQGQGGPSQTQQYGAAGMDAFSKYLMEYLSKQK